MSNALRTERKSVYTREPCACCRYHVVCSTQQMACVTFARFSGQMHGVLQKYADYPGAPNRVIYDTIFRLEDGDEALGTDTEVKVIMILAGLGAFVFSLYALHHLGAL